MTPARKRSALVAAVFLLPLAWPSAVAAAPASDRTVLSVGHVDAMQVYMDGDRLDLRVKDDTGAATRYRDPDDVLLQVLPEAEFPIPAGETWSFLGEAGDPMWMLPLTQDPDLLWPGWSTEPLARGQFQHDALSMELVEVAGPGEVILWSLSSFGQPSLYASTRDGLPDAIGVNVPAHVHSYWAFTAEGAYTLTWKVSGTLADGTPIATDEVDYHWHVGEPTDPDPDPDPDPGDPDLPDESDLEGRLVLDQGHVDVLAPALEDGELDLRTNDDTRLHDPAAVVRDPDDVVFHASPESEIVLSDHYANPGYSEVGSPGDTRWLLPDVQKQGVLFPGWDTNAVPDGALAGNNLDLALTDYAGPGELVMLTVDDFGDADVKIDSQDPLPQAITTRSRTHAHINWYFSEPGVYRLTWQATATTAGGAPIESEPRDYLFVVGELSDPGPDPDPVLERTQTITAEVDTDTGGLVLSVDPADRTVTLPAMTLSPDATRWTAAGQLRPVTVTDTRSADPGWNAVGQVTPFIQGDHEYSGSHLGWTPSITSASESQAVVPGPGVTSLLDGGPGLATSQLLASAPSGSGNGTAVLQAGLVLGLPTDVESGTYTALVTFTAI